MSRWGRKESSASSSPYICKFFFIFWNERGSRQGQRKKDALLIYIIFRRHKKKKLSFFFLLFLFLLLLRSSSSISLLFLWPLLPFLPLNSAGQLHHSVFFSSLSFKASFFFHPLLGKKGPFLFFLRASSSLSPFLFSAKLTDNLGDKKVRLARRRRKGSWGRRGKNFSNSNGAFTKKEELNVSTIPRRKKIFKKLCYKTFTSAVCRVGVWDSILPGFYPL